MSYHKNIHDVWKSPTIKDEDKQVKKTQEDDAEGDDVDADDTNNSGDEEEEEEKEEAAGESKQKDDDDQEEKENEEEEEEEKKEEEKDDEITEDEKEENKKMDDKWYTTHITKQRAVLCDTQYHSVSSVCRDIPYVPLYEEELETGEKNKGSLKLFCDANHRRILKAVYGASLKAIVVRACQLFGLDESLMCEFLVHVHATVNDPLQHILNHNKVFMDGGDTSTTRVWVVVNVHWEVRTPLLYRRAFEYVLDLRCDWWHQLHQILNLSVSTTSGLRLPVILALIKEYVPALEAPRPESSILGISRMFLSAMPYTLVNHLKSDCGETSPYDESIIDREMWLRLCRDSTSWNSWLHLHRHQVFSCLLHGH